MFIRLSPESQLLSNQEPSAGFDGRPIPAYLPGLKERTDLRARGGTRRSPSCSVDSEAFLMLFAALQADQASTEASELKHSTSMLLRPPAPGCIAATGRQRVSLSSPVEFRTWHPQLPQPLALANLPLIRVQNGSESRLIRRAAFFSRSIASFPSCFIVQSPADPPFLPIPP